MTLITLDDSDVRMVALIDVTVTQGELRTLAVRLPEGYELQSITGSSLEEFAPLGDEVVLTVGNPAARSHQFLVNLEAATSGRHVRSRDRRSSASRTCSASAARSASKASARWT